MRLIDADALKDIFTEYYGGRYEYTFVSTSDILKNIDDTPTVPQWISVEDRLPEDGEFVLVFDSLSNAHDIARYDKRNGLVTGWPEWEDAMITHWMPLPEAPEMSEG